MNKKLLFAAMSLAALTACTNDDDFGSKTIAEKASPVKFEVLNNNEAMTRASMDGNTIKWSAADGDLFTLYHGSADAPNYLKGYQNATYKASSEEGTAILSTPSMILPGRAIMTWPVDTIFRIGSTGNLSIAIPAEQTSIENSIPYVSDLIKIEEREDADPVTKPNWKIGDPNTAGYDRTYPVYMRPMASQLIVKADYAGTDETIAALYEGGAAEPAEGGIDPIKVTSVELLTKAGGATPFTTEIPVRFTAPSTAITTQWATVDNNAWEKITDFNIGGITAAGQTDKLTSKCLSGNESSKFLILPQANIAGSTPATVDEAGVVVRTIYGKVVISNPGATPPTTALYGTKYTATEYAAAWYRYLTDPTTKKAYEKTTTDKDADGKTKVTANIANGMMQTIDGFSAYKAGKGVVKGEPVGAAATRYVNVNLNYLDMSDLHITTDKQLRDAARVWQYLGSGSVTVYLDGDDDNEFEMSQLTIKVINEINAAAAKEETTRAFTVKPCTVATEACNTIVITGGGDIQNLAFIKDNSGAQADVAFAAGETWNWKGTVTVDATATGVKSFINEGTMTNGATATLAVYNNLATPGKVTNIGLVNDGKWNITAGTLNVQFDVTNNGELNIAKGAQYRQDGNTFKNEATTLPERFFLKDPSKTAAQKADFVEKIGVVNNNGVFATVSTGAIHNFGLIEHADKDAKTYITTNQTTISYGYAADASFATAFDATVGSENKMGRINLPYSNKDEDNISISASASQGFVSVTVTSDNAPANKQLDASVVGKYVNYVIINSGIEQITNVSDKVQYVEINDENNTEIAWMPRFNATTGAVIPYSYTGLIVFSDVNIKLDTQVNIKTTPIAGSTYIAADMYVGGTFTPNTYSGYFGNTTSNAATMVITY